MPHLNSFRYQSSMKDVNEERGLPRRLTRVETRARTREQLLDAAAFVFARKGFAGASVEEIAESAGYSTGALYSNFESKEQLFLELLSARRSRGIARRTTAIAEILDEEIADDADPLDALTRMFVRFADRDSEFAPLQAEFWLYAVRNPEAMGVMAEKLEEQLVALERLVAPLMERFGAAPAIPPRAVTSALLGLFQGLVRQRRVDPASVPDDLFAQAVRWLLAGVRSNASTLSAPLANRGRRARGRNEAR